MRCLAVVLAAVTGCSFAFVDGPPKTPSTRPVCTTGKGIPLLDSLFGTVELATGVIYLSGADTPGLDSGVASQMQTIGVLSLVSAAVHYVAALSGNSDVNRCLEAQAQWDAGK